MERATCRAPTQRFRRIPETLLRPTYRQRALASDEALSNPRMRVVAVFRRRSSSTLQGFRQNPPRLFATPPRVAEPALVDVPECSLPQRSTHLMHRISECLVDLASKGQ